MYLNAINHVFEAFFYQKTLSFKQSSCGFAGFNKQARYPLVFGRSLQLLIDRLSDPLAGKIGMAIQVVDLPVRLQISVADGLIVLIYGD